MSQGSTLAAPCGPWYFTFAPEGQEKKKIIILCKLHVYMIKMCITYKSILLTKNYKKLNVRGQKFTKYLLDLVKS